MRILFTPEAKRKLDLYVQLADVEVSGLGKVERLGREDFLVTDLLLFEQECSAGHTELSQEALVAFLTQLLEKGEDPGQYRLFWHSHVNFPVFWSRIDERTIERFNQSWLISVVANKKGEIRGRVDSFQPVHLYRDQVSVDVYLKTDDEQLEAIKVELEQKVQRKVFGYPVGSSRWDRERDWYGDWWEADYCDEKDED